MFNRDALFGRKDEPTGDPRAVNVSPALNAAPAMRPQTEPPKADLRFAEPARAPARAEEPVGSKLIVGPDIKLKGVEISNCDTLVVEGRVEASMDSRVVQIAQNGVFSGTVSIDVAEIHGRFEGELTARKQLVIYSTGRVSGRIRYGKIRIEEGGELTGEVTTLAAATTQQPEAIQQPAPQPAQPVQPPQQPAQAAAQKPPQAPPQSPQPQQPVVQTAPQKPTMAAASSAEKPRYEPMQRPVKQPGKGANPS